MAPSSLTADKNQSLLSKPGLNQTDLETLASQLAALLSGGDTVFLKGDLGAGKSTFARALIRAIAQDLGLDVPSPTFPLLIPYQTDRFDIAHYDLYRLGDPGEVEELGLYDHLSTYLTLIEWPEQIGAHQINDRLEILLEENDEGESRNVTLKGYGKGAVQLDRFSQIQTFVNNSDWGYANWSYLQGDASTRSYIRLQQNGQSALLMNALPQPDGPPVKDGKPYSQIAHLAEDMTSFVAIAQSLREEGFALPQIYNHDIGQGLLLISDLGDEQYFDLITNQGQDIGPLYEPAIDVLARLKQTRPKPMLVNNIPYTLPAYDQQALGIETQLTTNWYWPFVKNERCGEEHQSSFNAIWHDLFKQLETDNNNWVLRDFHSPNLIRLKGQTGISSVGIIDFQDALKGHAAYDVVSLCQDARLTIPVQSEQHLLNRYLNHMKAQDEAFNAEAFLTCYAILGAQRACKLLGIFVRLSKRDGKHHYLAHVPRIWDYLERSLSHPALQALKGWFHEHFPPHLRAPFFTKEKA